MQNRRELSPQNEGTSKRAPTPAETRKGVKHSNLSRKSEGHGDKAVGRDAGSVEGSRGSRVEAGAAHEAPNRAEHEDEKKDEESSDENRRKGQRLNPQGRG